MRQVTNPVVVLLLLVVPVVAAASDMESDWKKIGTVSQWMELDASFYRIIDDNGYQDQSQFRLDQKDAYSKSKGYREDFPVALGLDEFQKLSPEDQDNRHKLAVKQLKIVERFLITQQRRRQEIRENSPYRATSIVEDQRNLTDCLLALGFATGLDPSNFYAWHLQSYFSTCVGDVHKAHYSLLAAAKALNRVSPEGHLEIMQRVMLDLAWLERDQGHFIKAIQHLNMMTKTGKEPVESLLLRGLIAAQSGDQETALQIASLLRAQPVRIFPTNYTQVTMTPDRTDMTNWEKRDSDYLKNWILALMELQKGNRPLAGRTFREYSTNRNYAFAARFWNEAGLIYERTGRYDLAEKAWEVARINQPWLLHMIYKGYGIKLGQLTGNPKKAFYSMGFNSFYLSGSRLALGAKYVGEIGPIQELSAKQAMAARALEELEICQRSGQYPGQASVLQGQVYYLMGDYLGAQAELKEAKEYFSREGDDANLASVISDLEIVQQNLNVSGVDNFYSQSGNSQGRWSADGDPATTAAQLEERLAENPSDKGIHLELARHYIRNDQVDKGRQMAFHLYNPANIDEQTVEVVTLVLEADRILGKEEMADTMLRQLEKGQAERWNNAGLWALVSSICQNHGRNGDALKAMQMAAVVDPENKGIQNQLRMME
ncbi:MAG: hypothetical protein GY780_06590 [bacterium]|nr:hypothetical protein [bacterium]